MDPLNLEGLRYRRTHSRPAYEITIHLQRYWTAQHIRACRKAIRQGFYLACSIEGRVPIAIQEHLALSTVNRSNIEICAWHHAYKPVPIVTGLELDEDRQRYALHDRAFQPLWQVAKIVVWLGFLLWTLASAGYVAQWAIYKLGFGR